MPVPLQTARICLLLAVVGLAAAMAGPATARPSDRSTAAAPAQDASPEERRRTVCELIDTAAADHAIPVDFLTRLIWRESSFRAHVVSPKGAQGIAQFMPATAAERGLADPFDPGLAIPASASLLSDLRARFGNLGLAAAAYNAGAQRVSDWLAARGGLPWETRSYVYAITGRAAPDWISPPQDIAADDESEPSTCIEVAALLAAPNPSFPRIDQADWAPWGAQVAGNFSRERALASFAALQRRHADIIGDAAPMVVPTRRRARAPVFSVRLPAQSRDEANARCRELRGAGADCVVMRN